MLSVAYACLARIGITPLAVTIVGVHCLHAGEPMPDPLPLATKCLGYQASSCVVFGDSPGGVRAGVAAGAVVIATCRSHLHEQIEECGVHFIVDNLGSVHCKEMDSMFD
jgi:beta-phosphoglucomutase-like phosphatase (HAD superfamily)